MIRIRDIMMPPEHAPAQLVYEAARALRISGSKVKKLRVVRRSVDARKKPDIRIVYTVDVAVDGSENKILKQSGCKKASIAPVSYYKVPKMERFTEKRPVVVGFGPAGVFAALVLALAGQRPLVLERGEDAASRHEKVETFWQTGKLDPKSNVQFGEGGAGTFSDGKLNTGTKDPRNKFVLETFVQHGAPEEILWEARPHVGTDKLVAVVRSMRKEIESLGGQVLFRHQLTDLVVVGGKVTAAVVETPNGMKEFPCNNLVLALGHSARDTLRMLHQKGLHMEQKPFSLGVRIEHPQSLINISQYGDRWGVPPLPAAEYKLSTHLPNGRGIYTFCMCPGGQVVAAASQTGGVCTNGMSLFARDGKNANSGLLVGVSPEDFADSHPLAGVLLQEKVEQAAFRAAGSNYFAPTQLVGDFLKNQNSTAFGEVQPTYRPGTTFCRLEEYLPDFVTDSLRQALPILGQKLKGFDRADALLTGPETRSSSPVRMPRNEQYQANLLGVYPCGEGAGYAGGITSAAADGIRVALAILETVNGKLDGLK